MKEKRLPMSRDARENLCTRDPLRECALLTVPEDKRHVWDQKMDRRVREESFQFNSGSPACLLVEL